MESKALHDAPRCRRGHTEHGHTFVAHRGDLHMREWNKAETRGALSNTRTTSSHTATLGISLPTTPSTEQHECSFAPQTHGSSTRKPTVHQERDTACT